VLASDRPVERSVRRIVAAICDQARNPITCPQLSTLKSGAASKRAPVQHRLRYVFRLPAREHRRNVIVSKFHTDLFTAARTRDSSALRPTQEAQSHFSSQV
jgi:hypothetical protein